MRLTVNILTNLLILLIFALQSSALCANPGFSPKTRCHEVRARINVASSDRELFPSVRHANGPPQHRYAHRDLDGEREDHDHRRHNYGDAAFYDSSYGFSKEAINGLITQGTDYSSAEPTVDEIPAINSAYSDDYRHNYDIYSETGKEGSRNNEQPRYESPQNVDSKLASSYDIPVSLFKTFIQQVRQNKHFNKNSNHDDKPKRPSPAFDPDYLYRDNYASFAKSHYNSVDKQNGDEVPKSPRFRGEHYGEGVRGSVGNLKQSIRTQGGQYGPEADVVTDNENNNRDISSLLKQSYALGEYLKRLKEKAEADLAEDSDEASEPPRGRKDPIVFRGGRGAVRSRPVHKYSGA